MNRLDEFLGAFFPRDSEAIYLRALKAKGAPDSDLLRPVSIQTRRLELQGSRKMDEQTGACG